MLGPRVGPRAGWGALGPSAGWGEGWKALPVADTGVPAVGTGTHTTTGTAAAAAAQSPGPCAPTPDVARRWGRLGR